MIFISIKQLFLLILVFPDIHGGQDNPNDNYNDNDNDNPNYNDNDND